MDFPMAIPVRRVRRWANAVLEEGRDDAIIILVSY